jgi:adenine-specific DNA-methyltransferase
MKTTTLDGKTPDIAEENIGKLKQLFPEVFTEGKIDFEKLQQVLGEYVEDSNERYNFTWNGKGRALRLSQTPSLGTLRPCKEESKDWDTTQNLYIEGDNLEVLKLLQKSYHGKVKMIYIDPPYNTGKDFVYPDDFHDSLENYKKLTGQVDSEGNRISTNTEASGRYHTDWLNMMYPRLRLARNLLTDDGVIFISIDDNEAHNLRKQCDEIFGEENLLDVFYIQVRYENKSLNEKDDFQKLIEQVLVYAKSKHNFVPNKPYEEYDLGKFCNEVIEEAQGETIVLGGKKVTIYKPGQFRIVKHAEGRIGLLKDTWASGSVLTGNTSGKFFDRYIGSRKDIDGIGCLYKVEGIGEDGLGYRYFTGPKRENATKGQFYSGVPLIRIDELNSGSSRKYKPIINFYNMSGDFGNIRHEGSVDFRSGKKPTKMIRQFLEIVGDKNCLVLDFFSGSASTAHSVMQLNSEDTGNRKFIMVQLPEATDDPEFANICEIGKERIRRAGEKIKEEKGLEAMNLDVGFKVLKLDSSNIRKWQPDYNDLEQSLMDYVDNYVEGRTELDVVYEIMLKYGLDLTYPVDEFTIAQKKVYSIGFGMLMICLDDEITTDVAKGILEKIKELSPESSRVVFKDNGFKSDSNKTNIKEILKSGGIEEFITI